MTNAAGAERYARAGSLKDNLYVETDTADEINQFTAPPPAPSHEKAPALSRCARLDYSINEIGATSKVLATIVPSLFILFAFM